MCDIMNKVGVACRPKTNILSVGICYPITTKRSNLSRGTLDKSTGFNTWGKCYVMEI